MYVDSWQNNHRFHLIPPEEVNDLEGYSHILFFGSPSHFTLDAEVPTLTLDIPFDSPVSWQDIDDLLVFVGEAFIEDYRFDLLISSEVNMERAVSGYLIGKHATVGENRQEHKAFLDKINPAEQYYHRGMIETYGKVTGDNSLQELCDKLWRKHARSTNYSS